MIRLQRTMKVKRGKRKPTIHLFTSRFGSVSTLHWTIDFKDLATLETWQHKLGTDADILS